MPWMPGAVRKQLTQNVGKKRTTTNLVNFHVDAGNASTLFGWFSDPRCRDSCHFFVKKDGTIEQYADSALTTYTSRDGNWRSIGVETQGRDGEPWTEAQIQSCARVAAWVHGTHGVPLELVDSSRSSEAGIGCHRWGVDGNFPALPSILAGRQQRGGGELWSGSRGKSCPGDDRVRQMPRLLALAKGQADPVQEGVPYDAIAKYLDEPHTRELQGRLGVEADGEFGTGTADAVAKRLGVPVGEMVRGLQRYLNSDWFMKAHGRTKPLAVDGAFGPATADALETYIDGKGWALPPAPAPVVLRRDSKGEAVRALQVGLNKVFPTYSRLDLDGSYGPDVEAVIREFQKRVGLDVDGVVGPLTRAALDAEGVRF